MTGRTAVQTPHAKPGSTETGHAQTGTRQTKNGTMTTTLNGTGHGTRHFLDLKDFSA